MSLTKARQSIIDSTIVNVKDFGAVGDGVTDDTAAFKLAVVAAEGKTLVIPKTSNYYLLSEGIAVYPATTIEGNDSTIIFKPSVNGAWFVGFVLSSNCTLRNINGYRTSNGYTSSIGGPFINIGLFYAPTNSARAYYTAIIPDISGSSSPDGLWDAPRNVTVENITSDISSLDTTHQYGGSLIAIYNFVKNITVNNIRGIGFAEWTDYATSFVSSGTGVLNDNNYYDVVRFEWGHFVSGPTEIASGENLKVTNIYGKGLRNHDHSGVVSMGNAHSFVVQNIVGEQTAQVFHCGSSGNSTSLDTSVLRTNATNRIAENITGLDLYTWIDGSHYSAGVNISGDWEATSAISPFNQTIVRNVNIAGLGPDATAVGAGASYSYPEYGVLIGDSSWDSDVRNLVLENVSATKFRQGIFFNNCQNVSLTGGLLSYNGSNGLSISCNAAYKGKNIVINNVCIKKNNVDGATDYTTNTGSGATVFRGDNIRFLDCVFGDPDDTAGNETQLHSVFLRTGSIGFVMFDSCYFANYESASSYDITSNNSAIKPIIKNCRSVINADFTPKTYPIKQGYTTEVVAAAEFTAAPSTVTLTNEHNIASATYTSAGRYTFTFDHAQQGSTYYVLMTGSGSGTPEYFPVVYTKSSSSFDVYVKDASGSNVDPANNIQLVVMTVTEPATIL